MRIAILTQPLHRNYGGILQAYALQTFLQKYGHSVVIINRDSDHKLTLKLLIRRVGSVIKSCICLALLRKKEYVVMNPLSPFYHSRWSGYSVLPFVKHYINISGEIRSSSRLRKYFARNEFDIFIVGSDQVWRPCYSPNITDFFLKGVPNDSISKRIAYAASFGTDQWEFSIEETGECAQLIKLFDAVSVREKSGVKLCRDYFNVEAVHLLDPTMLLDDKDYIDLFRDSLPSKLRGGLFCYMLDESEEARNIIKSMENEGFIPNIVSVGVKSTSENPRPYQLSVEKWLQGIYESQFVITDSFHACVFSILFKKPFIVLGNRSRGNTRFESLLEMFNLECRMVKSYDEFVKLKTKIMKNEDLCYAYDLLLNYRKDSIYFFQQLNIIHND